MRRLVITGAVLAAFVPAGMAAATAPPSTEPASTAATETTMVVTETTMVVTETTAAPDDTGAGTDTTTAGTEAPAAETATVYDESGNPVATITMIGSELAATDYEEGNDPEAGNEYVRVTVLVESAITEGTFGISVDDFILQNNNGFVTTAETVPTAAQAEADEDITDEADLANGESLELVLTFEVVSSIGPRAVFYSAEDDILVDVATLA